MRNPMGIIIAIIAKILILSSIPMVSTFAAESWTPAYRKKNDPQVRTQTQKATLSSTSSPASTSPSTPTSGGSQLLDLKAAYQKNYKNKKEMMVLKAATLEHGTKSVPILIEVMKDRSFPEKNRWIATFLLGRIMGDKASPFIAKFLSHPDWVMRLASLKTLLSLKEKKYGSLYAEKLKDDSYIVRVQALENIRELHLDELAPQVWAMLFDESNYSGQKGKFKRTDLIKTCIKTVGDLKYHKIKSPMMDMIQKKKYDDVFDELDYSLGQITGKNSPDGDKTVKKHFWSRLDLGDKTL